MRSSVLGRVSKAALAIAMGGAPMCVALADATANHVVSVEVSSIEAISVGGGVTLNATTATAGSVPTATATSSYSFSTNGTKKITGHYTGTLPTNAALLADLTAPTGSGTSAGAVALGSGPGNAVDLVTSISNYFQAGLNIGYTLRAGVTGANGAVSPVTAAANVTVVYTLTAN